MGLGRELFNAARRLASGTEKVAATTLKSTKATSKFGRMWRSLKIFGKRTAPRFLIRHKKKLIIGLAGAGAAAAIYGVYKWRSSQGSGSYVEDYDVDSDVGGFMDINVQQSIGDERVAIAALKRAVDRLHSRYQNAKLMDQRAMVLELTGCYHTLIATNREINFFESADRMSRACRLATVTPESDGWNPQIQSFVSNFDNEPNLGEIAEAVLIIGAMDTSGISMADSDMFFKVATSRS